MNDFVVVGDYGGMGELDVYVPARYWRNNQGMLKFVGQIFVGSNRKTLKNRPVDLGYVPGEKEEGEQPINVTEVIGELVIANDLVETGD